MILLNANAVSVGATLLVDVDLDGNRHSSQQPDGFTGSDLRIDGPCRRDCLFRQRLHHGVNGRIDLLLTLQRLLGYFDGGQLAITDAGRNNFNSGTSSALSLPK